ncbi:MAG TPA: site-specific integrase, partial [Telmatospirillum sp.]|nr:site-specific integrase [Telmatospirillum sp.]
MVAETWMGREIDNITESWLTLTAPYKKQMIMEFNQLSPEGQRELMNRITDIIFQAQDELLEWKEVIVADKLALLKHKLTQKEKEEARLLGVVEGMKAVMASGSPTASAPPIPVKDPYEGLDKEHAVMPCSVHLPAYLATIGSRSKSTVSAYELTFKRLEALLGAKAVADVTTLDVEMFYQSLVETPTDKGEGYLKYDTINRSISNIRAYYRWAVSKHYAEDNPARKVVVWPDAEDENDDDPVRRPFTPEELTKLFDAPLFVGCKNVTRVYEPGRVLVRNHKFFFPLVGYLSGMRLSEIRQLEFEDIIEVNGRPHFSINRQSNHGHQKTTKTKSSRRVVPVHPLLFKLGFMDWVERRKTESSDGRIFVDFRYSNWWNQCFLPNVGIKTEQTCFHSWRHGFRDML